MTLQHHEVPTHLNVEDKILLGLTARQFLYLLVGSSTTYLVWDQSTSFGQLPRLVLAGVLVLITLVFALLRPAGRAPEEWLTAALAFAAAPKRATWRPRTPAASDWRLADASWHELAPSLAWADQEGEA
jgi:PrgI family protein